MVDPRGRANIVIVKFSNDLAANEYLEHTSTNYRVNLSCRGLVFLGDLGWGETGIDVGSHGVTRKEAVTLRSPEDLDGVARGQVYAWC